MQQSTVNTYTHVSTLMRVIAAGVLFVYTSVIVSPGVHAAQQIVEGAINEATARERAAEVSHATTLEETVRQLTVLRSKRGRAVAITAMEEERRSLGELREKLVAETRKAQSELELFETRLRDWNVPEVILERHRTAVQELNDQARKSEHALREILEGTDASLVDARLDALLKNLESIRTRKPHQRFDASQMPYTPASGKVRAPKLTREEFGALLSAPTEPRVLLASATPSLALQVSGSVTPEYLAETEDVQLTQDIRDLALHLNSNPVAIYNWVRNNIQFLPTFGSIQGSQLTLENGRGNAFDTASLLIALYRAARIPARYAFGTVEVPIEKAMNWVGVSTADQAQELFGQGGIPNVAVTSGGKIKALRFEHVWVEVWVDFIPSRGAKNIAGDTWVALDASFKRYIVEQGVDPADAVPFDASATLATLTEASQVDGANGVVTSLDVAQMKATFRGYESQFAEALDQAHPGLTSLDLLDRRYIDSSEEPVLPTGLPYKRLVLGNTFATLPSSLRHYLRVSLYASALDQSEDLPQLSRAISLPAIGLRRVSVSYRPASDADAALMQNAVTSGATSLPAYLIRVVPELKIDDAVLTEGTAVTMGSAQFWGARLSGPIPAGNADVPFQHTVAGDVLVFSVDAAGITGSAALLRRGKYLEPNAAEDMHFAGLSYWTAHNWTDRSTAEGMGGRVVRLPSLALLSAGFTPRYFFGIARQASYLGRVLDARRVSIAAVAPTSNVRRAIVLLAGIQGSQWEATSLNSVFGRKERTAMSATEYMTYATTHGVPIQVVAPDNLSTALANLQVSPDVVADISAAVQTGKIAMVPQRDLNVRGRVGNGYVIVDPETGAGAYLIDGGLNGGFECPCSGPSATPPVASIGGGAAAASISAAALPALAEISSTVPRIAQTEGALVRLAEIGAQAANSPHFAQVRSMAPRLSPPVAFRIVAGGFVLAIGAALLTSVIFATAFSIAVIFTYHMAQIELALLAAEGGAEAAVYPTPAPSAEPSPDEDDCKCENNPELPECQCTFVPACPHRGYDEIHNTCADEVSGNVFPKCDVLVTTPTGRQKHFDAMSADGTLWEVKTERYSTYNPFVQRATTTDDFVEGIPSAAIAKACNRSFNYVVADKEHYDALVRLGFETVPTRLQLEEGCLKPPGGQ